MYVSNASYALKTDRTTTVISYLTTYESINDLYIKLYS